jgi:hypothetical protein
LLDKDSAAALLEVDSAATLLDVDSAGVIVPVEACAESEATEPEALDPAALSVRSRSRSPLQPTITAAVSPARSQAEPLDRRILDM